MQQLAQIYNGKGPLYVTMFTEFETYPCTDNQWVGSENYYKALKDQYRAAKNIFHQYAPNSKVSLGWGGWQSRFDDPAQGGGLSLFPYFADVMRESDFQSFQAMETDTNVNVVQDMTRILGAYGPVMLAHYKPANGSQATFDADMRAMLTGSFLTQLTRYGLFAWSFMDYDNLSQSSTIYQAVKGAIRHYG